MSPFDGSRHTAIRHSIPIHNKGFVLARRRAPAPVRPTSPDQVRTTGPQGRREQTVHIGYALAQGFVGSTHCLCQVGGGPSCPEPPPCGLLVAYSAGSELEPKPLAGRFGCSRGEKLLHDRSGIESESAYGVRVE